MSTNLIHQRDVLCEAVTILAGVDSVADAVRMAALQKLNADWQTNLSYAHTDDEVDRRALKREDIGVCAVEDCIYRSHGLTSNMIYDDTDETQRVFVCSSFDHFKQAATDFTKTISHWLAPVR